MTRGRLVTGEQLSALEEALRPPFSIFNSELISSWLSGGLARFRPWKASRVSAHTCKSSRLKGSAYLGMGAAEVEH
jgi:hypothetical protein